MSLCINLSSILQVISLPNLRIIDVGYGFTGSTHDATAWSKTYLAQNHESVLLDGEFIWADSAYPVCPTLKYHTNTLTQLDTRSLYG